MVLNRSCPAVSHYAARGASVARSRPVSLPSLDRHHSWWEQLLPPHASSTYYRPASPSPLLLPHHSRSYTPALELPHPASTPVERSPSTHNLQFDPLALEFDRADLEINPNGRDEAGRPRVVTEPEEEARFTDTCTARGEATRRECQSRGEHGRERREYAPESPIRSIWGTWDVVSGVCGRGGG